MNLFLVPAGGTGVMFVEIAAMGPAVVRVGVETGFLGFVFCFSNALGVAYHSLQDRKGVI